MSDRPSRIVLTARLFVTIFVIVFLISLFWNVLSGSNMFPLSAVFGVSVILTVISIVTGWIVVTGGTEVLHRNDPQYQEWKRKGGRPYWDSLGWPVNTATPVERQTGWKEPKYTDFLPPSHWTYQCPVCHARVEHAIDICWRCGYGK